MRQLACSHSLEETKLEDFEMCLNSGLSIQTKRITYGHMCLQVGLLTELHYLVGLELETTPMLCLEEQRGHLGGTTMSVSALMQTSLNYAEKPTKWDGHRHSGGF